MAARNDVPLACREREPEAHSAQAGPFQSQTINCWANYKLRAGRARRRLTPTPFSFKPSEDNNIAPPGPPLFGRQTPPFAATSIFFWGSPKQQLIQHFRPSAASGKKKSGLITSISGCTYGNRCKPPGRFLPSAPSCCFAPSAERLWVSVLS